MSPGHTTSWRTTMSFDLVIRGGHVVDGSGAPIRRADVGILGDRIAAVDAGLGAGREEIDARDRIVTPGFIDLHTHFDGQVTWSDRLTPSSANGVTTVVTGNCGVGFAPCRPEDRENLISLMSGVEDIPEVVMAEGLPWDWESFEDYLAAVDERPHDVDIAALVPHSALRVYVMGDRAIRREDATEDDIARMADLMRVAMACGAAGFATSRALQHRSSKGAPIPTVRAAEKELQAIASVLGAAGRGVFQLLSDFDLYTDVEGEFAMFRRLVETSGRPLMFTLQQKHNDPHQWRHLLALSETANDQGLPIRPQVHSRPSGLLLGLELSRNPFSACPSVEALQPLSFGARLTALRDGGMRGTVLAEARAGGAHGIDWTRMFRISDRPDYEPPASESIAQLSAAAEVDPAEYALDLMLARDGRAILLAAAQNFAEGSLEPTREMITHRDTLIALGDAGAHCGLVCDGSYTTTLLTHWTRDRTRGPKVSLEWAVKSMTSEPATAIGLADRGEVREGLRADLNVIDYARLEQRAPHVVYDLPTGGRRIVQEAVGYDATLLAGQVTYRHGRAVGPTPGRVVRFGQEQ